MRAGDDALGEALGEATLHAGAGGRWVSVRTPDGGEAEIALGLRELPGFTLAFPYAHFTPVSTSRPWALQAAPLRGLRARPNGAGGLVVRGRATLRPAGPAAGSPAGSPAASPPPDPAAGPAGASPAGFSVGLPVGFSIEDRWAWRGEQLWLRRRWSWDGGEAPPAGPGPAGGGAADTPLLALGTRVPTGSGLGAHVTLPGVSYNGNPSADPARLVPRLGGEPGSTLVVEEHRLPLPGVNVAWMRDGAGFQLSLLALPATIRLPGAGPDHAWSLGAHQAVDGVEALSLSGVVALGAARDTVYGGQNRALPHPGGGYLRLGPGDVLEKTLILDFGPCPLPGHACRRFVRVGWAALRPSVAPALGPEETIALKAHALQARWREEGGVGGFLVATPTAAEGNIHDRPPGFLFGWTGQSLRLAWCALALGRTRGDPAWTARGRAVLDAFAAPAGRRGPARPRSLYYALPERRWYADGKRQAERYSSRMQGEALANLADCLALLAAQGEPLPPAWVEALEEGLTFLADPGRTNAQGILPTFLDPEGRPTDQAVHTAGVPAVVALLLGGEVLGRAEWRHRGLELLARYTELFARTMERPFSRSTLDAACEDKEAGLYYFLAAYHAHRLTGEAALGEQARLAAEWAATFVYAWDVEFPPGGPCARHGFRSTGWPSVSVQNQHLDVFFFPWEVADLGQRLGDPFLRDLGRLVGQACTHGIARVPGDWGYPTAGEQGEAFFQTEWSGRGGCTPWNPAWIIALVLQPALRLAHPELNARGRAQGAPGAAP